MIPYLEKLFGHIPGYFSSFFQLLAAPRKTITAQAANPDEKAMVEKSIVFLFVSFVITLLLMVLAGDNPLEIDVIKRRDESELTVLLGKAFFYLLCIGFCVLIVKFAYRLVGGKATFGQTFSATAAMLAMFLVFSGLIDLVIIGLMNLDPQVAKMQVLMEKESAAQQQVLMNLMDSLSSGNSQLDTTDLNKSADWISNGTLAVEKMKQRPAVKMALVVGALLYVPVFIWLLFAWLGMQEVQQVAVGKNVVALVVAVIGLLVFTAVWNTIEGGIMLRKQMKQRYEQDSSQSLKDVLSFKDEHRLWMDPHYYSHPPFLVTQTV